MAFTQRPMITKAEKAYAHSLIANVRQARLGKDRALQSKLALRKKQKESRRANR